MRDVINGRSPSSIKSERTFSVTGFYITKFRCRSLVFLKHISQKEEQEEKDNIEKERLEKNLAKT